jgi:CMP-N-acetylneuraminic acid synthetase
VLLYSTVPLRTVETVEEAVKMVTEDSYDSVLSLYEEDDYLWEADGDIVHPAC